MTQIRRVTRSVSLPKARRPDAAEARCVSHETAVARLATVTHLFPARSIPDTAKVTNIFVDLADDHEARSPAARARARTAARMPDATLPSITNIFSETCDDLSPEAEAQMVARLAARPRKMDVARAEITAIHAERAAEAKPFAGVPMREMGGIAAGVSALLTMLHVLPVPNV